MKRTVCKAICEWSFCFFAGELPLEHRGDLRENAFTDEQVTGFVGTLKGFLDLRIHEE